jgi:hypothetical protein
MVDNAAYINKTNNLLQLKQKKTMIYGIGNLGYGLGQAQKCGWVKIMVNGIPPSAQST